MANGVIHMLKLIDVDQQNPIVSAKLLVFQNCLPHPEFHETAVERSSERITQCKVFQFTDATLDLLLFCYIGEDFHGPDDQARSIAQWRDAHADWNTVASLVAQIDLSLPALAITNRTGEGAAVQTKSATFFINVL